jgi:uncharacterized protein (DUF1778 family)
MVCGLLLTRREELMCERYDTSAKAAINLDEEHLIRLTPEERAKFVEALRNPPEPTAALASFERARRYGHYKIIE